MNEVFEYRRFGALARKYYRENRRLGIIFLGIIGIITFLCLCKFNPFLREYTQVENPAEVSDFIQYYKGVYRQLFWGLYGLFALVVALHSLRDFVVKDKILNTLLLPASVFEKYVLAFLNSTVVLLVVYLLMFYALASVTSSYKFTGLNRLEYVSGSFGNQVPAMTPGQEVVHTEIGNVFNFSEGGYLMNISYDQKADQWDCSEYGCHLVFICNVGRHVGIGHFPEASFYIDFFGSCDIFIGLGSRFRLVGE